ncbi:MAG: NADH-quinone oxidoreductase subunit J [Candidatus Eremiobacteraeota bacterium]|nr:NADH-quinone oxidoreductase subunit J [Candidatus Eremiobacteraeota bacterium]
MLVASAVFVISQRKPVYSVVGLLVHFAVLAIFYLTLNAEFLAVIQIVIYSGAILILFVFVIALLSSGVAPFSVGPNRMPKAAVPAAALALIALGLVVYGIVRTPLVTAGAHAATSIPGPAGTANVFGSVADFGKALFTTHLLPFEMTAFILMVAVIGVVALAGEEAPFVPSLRRARIVEREMREAILRGGER